MPDINQSGPGWYCFKALPKREHIAARILGQLPAIEVLCPRIAYMKNTRRGKVRFIECLFPGYLFVHADLREYYRLIRSTQGIRDVVAFGERIPVVPTDFLDDLKAHLDEGSELKVVSDPTPQPGMEVKITEGPLRDFNAIVSGEMDAQQRVALLLDFLGRQMEVKMPREDVMIQENQPRRAVWEL